MTCTVSLEGVQSFGGDETRALALLKVVLNDVEYDWKAFVPENTDLQTFMDTIGPIVEAEILAKEQLWQNLTPKTKTIDIFGTGPVEVPIEKSEIVCPSIPDYYALRRTEYPHMGDQLDAFWKGPNSSEYSAMLQKIEAVKQKYPKP